VIARIDHLAELAIPLSQSAFQPSDGGLIGTARIDLVDRRICVATRALGLPPEKWSSLK